MPSKYGIRTLRSSHLENSRIDLNALYRPCLMKLCPLPPTLPIPNLACTNDLRFSFYNILRLWSVSSIHIHHDASTYRYLCPGSVPYLGRSNAVPFEVRRPPLRSKLPIQVIGLEPGPEQEGDVSSRLHLRPLPLFMSSQPGK